jgi:signal transduction histidine kinase/CheY-like chemotaxis protein
MIARQQIDDRHRFLIDKISDGIIVADQDGMLRFANPAAAALLDRNPSELLGQPIGLPIIDADFVEVNLVRHDGTPCFAELRIVEAEWDGNPAYVLSLRDTTLKHEAAEERARHRRELAEKERQILQSQKMEAVGRLAGGIAHDFNNLLSIITGYASLIKAGDGTVKVHAERIVQTTERAARLTRQLLVFSRNQVLQPRAWPLNHIVKESAELFGRLIPENIEVKLQLSSDAGNVKVDRVQIEQVIVNLLINSRDAMLESGKITIETGSLDPLQTTGRELAGTEANPHAVLRVIDNGCGMTPEVKAKAFDPFFTTKGPGLGTGLGLSTVYGIVKQSGGEIRLHSDIGKGTCVEILLPLTEESVSVQVESVRTQPAPRHGSETILFVEDEGALREMLGMILRQNGYNVLEARNGKDALRLIESHDGEIHVLITDLVMPEMNGIELAEELIRSRPTLPVIYVSGYSDQAIQPGPLIECLEKPFSPEVLLRTLRSVLESSSAGSSC